MNKYVFLTMNIGGINGAEQYILNKMNYLRRIGHQVWVFSGRSSDILIHAFEPFVPLIRPAMRFYPSSLSKAERERYLDWVVSELDVQPDDDFLVESGNITCAMWGELIAERLGCRHFAFIMQENFDYSGEIKQFLSFKVSRHELAGITKDSLRQMLGDLAPEPRADTYVRAFCTNVVQDCEESVSDRLDPQADFTIGSIGRLEKKYVLPLIGDLCAYFRLHADQRFNLVLIGGCADIRQEEAIRKAVGACSNVTLLMTGAMYPIPRALVRRIDLFFSSSGSAAATYYAGRPSVKVDFNTGKPIGMHGYDYDLRIGSPTKEPLSSGQYIDLLMYQKPEISFLENYESEYDASMYAEFDRHLQIARQPMEPAYYPVCGLLYSDLKYRLCSVLSRAFGANFAYRLVESARKAVRT